jgi:hypothetical protein
MVRREMTRPKAVRGSRLALTQALEAMTDAIALTTLCAETGWRPPSRLVAARVLERFGFDLGLEPVGPEAPTRLMVRRKPGSGT